MNPTRCSPADYRAKQVVSSDRCTYTEAARCQLSEAAAPAHDAFASLPADSGAAAERGAKRR